MKWILIIIAMVGNSILADTIPDDFSLSLNDGGGMYPRTEKLKISNNECKYTFWTMQNGKNINQATNFKMSSLELENLYKVLVENKYQEIVSEEKGHVQDRGGIEIEIEANGKKVTISNKYSSFIEEKWMGHWNEIIKHLKQIMKKQRKNESKSISEETLPKK